MSQIYFFSEETSFHLENSSIHEKWLSFVAAEENNGINQLNYIFCSDEYLLKINIEHLNHNTFTDVITFEYASMPIEGDIFISIDRIKENASEFNVSFMNELNRVMVHGLLHLLGYKDKTKEDKIEMTRKEDYYLSKLEKF